MSNKNYKKVTRATYDHIAEDYVKRDLGVVPETLEVKDALVHFIKSLPRHGTVLDIGSGGGRDARFLHKHGLRVTGIDFSPRMVAEARRISPQIKFKVMDIEHLRFKPQEFDGIWTNASLHHMPKRKLPAVLRNIFEIIKPGGILFLKVKYGKGEGMRINTKFGKRIAIYFAFYQVRELNQYLRRSDFRILSTLIGPRREWIDTYARKPQ